MPIRTCRAVHNPNLSGANERYDKGRARAHSLVYGHPCNSYSGWPNIENDVIGRRTRIVSHERCEKRRWRLRWKNILGVCRYIRICAGISTQNAAYRTSISHLQSTSQLRDAYKSPTAQLHDSLIENLYKHINHKSQAQNHKNTIPLQSTEPISEPNAHTTIT